MGLLRYKQFSSTPDLFSKIQSKREQIEKFSLSWKEFATNNLEQIFRSTFFSAAGTQTIFQVPEGFDFFLTNVSISAENTTGIDGIKMITIDVDSTFDVIRILVKEAGNNTSASNDFNMPIKVNSLLRLTTSASCSAVATIVGFLKPNSKEVV